MNNIVSTQTFNTYRNGNKETLKNSEGKISKTIEFITTFTDSNGEESFGIDYVSFSWIDSEWKVCWIQTHDGKIVNIPENHH